MKLTPTVYSVSDYLDLLNEKLGGIEMAIQGEITSLNLRNHAYFSISDGKSKEKAVLSCALWQFRLKRLPFTLEEGMEVQIIGKANIYKPSGRLTFIVEHIIPVGEGALQKAFEALKKKLEEKGYFADERKQELPKFPVKIGLITSETGDAIRDFKKHLGDFGFRVFHKDARVEGIYAIDSIVEGIKWFNEHQETMDVLVLTRGGGSLESLQAFNSEEVAQAIYASKIPVVSAVGHERDITIADLVADARASTPTDAGRLLSENWRFSKQRLIHFSQSFTGIMEKIISSHKEKMNNQWERMTSRFFSKMDYFFEKRNYFSQSIFSHFQKMIFHLKQNMESMEKQLLANDPNLKLKQGYSFIKDENGKIIKSVEKISKNKKILITVSDGGFGATVDKKEL